MKNHLLVTTIALLALANSIEVFAHCEVPCGIYSDQHRFEEMLEDTATIAKGIEQIRELTRSFENNTDALAVNQAASGRRGLAFSRKRGLHDNPAVKSHRKRPPAPCSS